MTNPSAPVPGPQVPPQPAVNPVPPLSAELIRGQLEKRRMSLISQLEQVENAIDAMSSNEVAEGIIAVLKAGTKL